MALSGMIVNEADALFAQLADYFVPTEELDALWSAMLAAPWSANDKANRTALTQSLLKLHRKYHLGLPLSNLRQYYDAIRFITSQPDVQAIKDCLVVAAQEDPFFKPMADNLVNGSPTAAHVTFEYMRRSKQLSIEQVLALDLVLAKQFQRHHDFSEGVRALLIDKDKAPKWSPARLEEVSDELISGHFIVA